MKKQIFIFIYFNLLSSFLNAQLWEHYYPPGPYETSARGIFQDYDGGYIITGVQENPYTSSFIYKLDADGNIIWQKTVGLINDNVRIYSVCPSFNGGYLMCGISYKYDPSGAAFVMKLNECAERVWAHEFGISGQYDFFRSIRQTADSNYILGGFGLGNNATERVSLVKINDTGDSLWYGDYSHYSTPVLTNILSAPDSFTYITGYTWAPDSGTTTPYYYRTFLTKVDNSGNEIWNRIYGLNNYLSLGVDVIQTPDSGFLILSNYVPLTSTWPYAWWNYLIKTDSYGNEQWRKFVSDTNALAESSARLIKLSDSTVLILCEVSYAYNINTIDDYHLKAIKIDFQGNVLDSVQFGNGVNIVVDAILNNEGNIVICGFHEAFPLTSAFAIKITQNLLIDTLLNIILNYDSLCPFTIIDGVIPYDTGVFVGISPLLVFYEQENVNVFPNPFSNHITIKSNYPEKNGAGKTGEIEIRNVLGEIVFQSKVNSPENIFNLNKLKAGMYFLTFKTKDNFFGRKIIKE